MNSSLRTWTQSSAPTLKREVCVVAGLCLSSQRLGSRNMGNAELLYKSQPMRESVSKIWCVALDGKHTVLWSWPQHTCAYNYTQVHSNTRVCTYANTYMHTHMGGEKYTERMQILCLTKVCLDILNIQLHRICRHLC